MQSDSSANRTWSEWTSAVEWTATVLIPSSRAARMTRSAISPRLAMRILENISTPPASCGLETEERFSVLDRAPVLDEDLDEASRFVRLDLVHELHRLDDAEDLPLLNHRAHLHERRVVGGSGSIERPDERRIDGEGVIDRGGRRLLRGRRCNLRRCRTRGNHWRRERRRSDRNRGRDAHLRHGGHGRRGDLEGVYGRGRRRRMTEANDQRLRAVVPVVAADLGPSQCIEYVLQLVDVHGTLWD